MIKIETNVPIPPKKAGIHSRDSIYEAVKQMRVGDSFYVEQLDEEDTHKIQSRYLTAFKYLRNHPAKDFNFKFTSRTEGNGVRFWRIE
jgi:retron-type reverse transcriptase